MHPPDPAVMERLTWWSHQDSRIKVVGRERNGHISEASNSALAIATGDFVALLDNDDLLPRDALTWIADAIVKKPAVQIIYSDEDKIDESGQRFGPYFKSDWNYSLFLGHNLISHLGVYRTSLIRDVGGFRKGLEGSQDYDLALRCIERIAPEQIVHLPRFLYHWRTLPGSTALGADEKPYALINGQKALQEHLSRVWPGARTEILPTWNYRCVPPRLTESGSLTVVLLSNDVASTQIPDWLRSPSMQHLVGATVRCRPDGLDVGQAITRAGTEYVALIDASLTPMQADALEEMVHLTTRSDVGIVGGAIYDAAGCLRDGGLVLNWQRIASPMHEGLPLANNGYMGRALLTQELSAVSLHCAVVRRSAFMGVNTLYHARALGKLASVEYCLSLKNTGMKTLWSPRSRWRQEGKADLTSLNDESTDAAGLERVRKAFGTWLRHDPAYHPALNPNKADFSLIPLGDTDPRPAS
jgi:hypothetical protein